MMFPSFPDLLGNMAQNIVAETGEGVNLDNLIKCPSLVGNSITEEGLKTLVARGCGAEVLADTCRHHGYTTASALGSLLTIDKTSGKVQGARFAIIAEAGVSVMNLDVGVKKIWAEADDRQLNVHFNIMPGDLVFSADASGKKGARCFSEWVDAYASDSVSTPGLDKAEWTSKAGLKNGACWRLCVEPESPEYARVRVLVVPVAMEELLQRATDNGTNVEDPAMPAISLANNLKLRFFPPQGTQGAGLGFLPLLYYNTPDQDVVLPTLEEIKKEHFNLLRDVGKPNLSKTAEWEDRYADTHWADLREPTLVWPAPPPPPPTAAPGEYTC